ncbi:MAG: hypothetical protein A2V88_11735 [Elusimicrobia bacterium RBG_16_66_12]|nr:MAG: hypothetical protein A2V88_11735 [Elusimicrobia bacterium RBG_16_66_12]
MQPPQATLIKTGLVHAQFESIHPFLDGNGRVGRLLIPLLYLSLYFKQRRTEYYEALMNVRLHGTWEEWLAFYLAGVEEVAKESAETADRAVKTFAADRRQLAGLIQAMARLRRLGIVREISGKRRKQVFSYHAYWKLISKGMGKAE